MEKKRINRIALGLNFFLSGFCFATWASRIPTLKALYDLNEAELGSLLFIMPISSLIGLPISGWLVSKFDSRYPLLIGFVFYSMAIVGIGYAPNIYFLGVVLFVFSFSMRVLNISMNTQSVILQKSFSKKINGSFHGLWSTGSLFGILLATLLVQWKVTFPFHLNLVAGITFISSFLSFRYLLQNDRQPSGNKLTFGKPDKFIFYLGLLVFFAAVCEGGLYDWSGVYFNEVVGEELFTLGYLIFMTFMAISRFVSDKLVDFIGESKMYIFSSSLVFIGIGTVILFPSFWPALFGFSITGIGVASVFPMTFTLAAQSKKYAPGMAISIIATYGTIGMLLAPPLIGYIAHLLGLRVAFLLFILASLIIIPISRQVLKVLETGK